jgi:hypothetical protein
MRRALLLAASGLSLLAGSAQALTVGQLITLARHKAAIAAGGGFIPSLMVGDGDSYIGNGGGIVYSTSSVTATVGGGASLYGGLASRSGNVALLARDNYAVGAKTSWSILDAIATARRDAGISTSTASTISGTTLTVGGTVSGLFDLNATLVGTGITGQNVVITGFGTGLTGAGTYTVSNPNGVNISTAQEIDVTYNPSFNSTASAADKPWNVNSSGQYSAVSDPKANVVILHNGTNDQGRMTSLQSFTNIAAELDILGPVGGYVEGVFVTGANKRVIMGNAHPVGRATVTSEVHAIAATVTALDPVLSSGGVFDTYNLTSPLRVSTTSTRRTWRLGFP